MTTDWEHVDLGPVTCLAVDGQGDPNTSKEYADALAALYAAGYAVRSVVKKAGTGVFKVGPLEGLWHADDMDVFIRSERADWRWTMLIGLPEWVRAEDIEAGLAAAADKAKRKDLPALPLLRVIVLHEGECLQLTHVGSYAAEAPVLARLHHEVMPERGLTFNGDHHEIYLSDPRRTPPERLRTILRQPVRPAAPTG